MVFSSLFGMYKIRNWLVIYPQNLWIRLWINNKNFIEPNSGLQKENLYIFYTIGLFSIFFIYLQRCIRVMFLKQTVIRSLY